MKERVLELLEELVGAHTLGQKRSKADEIAAIVKTAVFVADQFEGDPEQGSAVQPAPLPIGTVSGLFNSGNLMLVPTQAPASDASESLLPSEVARISAAMSLAAAEHDELSVLANESPLVSHE